MPAWWPKKSGKSREEATPSPKTTHHHHHNSFPKSPVGNFKEPKPHKSFDDVFLKKSPRNSRDLGCGSSGGFFGDCAEKRDVPLPLPTAFGVENGSVSVSSVSSSGSSEDHPAVNGHGQFGPFRGLSDSKFTELPRSPGPCSRGPTSPTSPLHPRLESPSSSQCYRLPLPPSSPTNPSSRTSESSTVSFSKAKKGRLLGRGTFGHVYLGFSEGRMCAIKEVKVASDDRALRECLRQLNQEINLLSHLSHKNIVRYYGSEMGEEALSVYLEYVSGGSIHKLLEEYGQFEEPVIRNYTRQITSGLAYLHGRNVVHRDIKGANILVHPNGEVKLSDFGMAKHMTSVSSMLSFKGSPYWMAPELVMNGTGCSLSVDIWSLGCTILEMATSKPPWSQYEGVAAIFKIGNSKDVPEIPDHLSNDAKDFIRLCLQRDPAARPSASDLLDHRFLRDQASTSSSSTNVSRDAFPSKFDGSRTPDSFLTKFDGSRTPDSFPTKFDGSRTPDSFPTKFDGTRTLDSFPPKFDGTFTPDALSSKLDGTRTPPPALDLHSYRPSTVVEMEYVARPIRRTSKASTSPRENTRMITSLPVSPCSSPLRQHGSAAYKSCFLSPQHPNFSSPTGQSSSHALNNDFAIYSLRPNMMTTTFSPDGFKEPPRRMRII